MSKSERKIDQYSLGSDKILEKDPELHDNILHTIDSFLDRDFSTDRINSSGEILEKYTIVYTRTYKED